MSQEEAFALAIADLESERLSQTQEVYEQEVYEVENYLEEDFHFDIKTPNASSKIYHLLQHLWSEGLLEVFVKNSILSDKLEVKDLVAFDASRFTKVVLEVLKLKLLKQEEAWGLLFLNAQRVQDSFESLEAFKRAYLKGALYYEILFKSDEENRGEKIEHFDALLQTQYTHSQVNFAWLKEDIFSTLTITQSSQMHQLLAQENKKTLWQFLDTLSQNERNELLPQLYLLTENITAEDYLELPALYPNVAYAHYLRGRYFYHYAWEARGLGLTNSVGQKNYALFYERLRYARADLKKAYELSPNEQTYWAELYNLVKHFKNKDSDHLEEELYERIKKDAMQNPYCVQRVAHMKKARWGGSHEESLAWAREVVSQSAYGNSLKIMLFEALIEQYHFIMEYDRDEERANAIFEDEALQNEVNAYFDELVEDERVRETLLFWYGKVGDLARLQKLN